MNPLVITLIFALIGLFAGSFAGAQVWRLRARQLRQDHEAGEKVPKADKEQVHALKKMSVMKDRSVCLHCGHQLAWYDLIPLVSWTLLRGKCRYCHKPIGKLEPLLELGMAVFFIASLLFWPLPMVSTYDIIRFVLWLVVGVGLIILAVYDSKWFLLPNMVVFPLLVIAIINAGIVWAQSGFTAGVLTSIIGSCLILSGLYYLIFVVSKHQWVGFGDVKLGLVLALMLSNWGLALLALFLANLIGSLIVLPLMATGRVKRGAHIPFGPMLIGGYFVAGLFGISIISWYLTVTLHLV
jgi:leader peptidase (prepilin peptidase)/N-methyltransferase